MSSDFSNIDFLLNLDKDNGDFCSLDYFKSLTVKEKYFILSSLFAQKNTKHLKLLLPYLNLDASNNNEGVYWIMNDQKNLGYIADVVWSLNMRLHDIGIDCARVVDFIDYEREVEKKEKIKILLKIVDKEHDFFDEQSMEKLFKIFFHQINNDYLENIKCFFQIKDKIKNNFTENFFKTAEGEEFIYYLFKNVEDKKKVIKMLNQDDLNIIKSITEVVLSNINQEHSKIISVYLEVNNVLNIKKDKELYDVCLSLIKNENIIMEYGSLEIMNETLKRSWQYVKNNKLYDEALLNGFVAGIANFIQKNYRTFIFKNKLNKLIKLDKYYNSKNFWEKNKDWIKENFNSFYIICFSFDNIDLLINYWDELSNQVKSFDLIEEMGRLPPNYLYCAKWNRFFQKVKEYYENKNINWIPKFLKGSLFTEMAGWHDSTYYSGYMHVLFGKILKDANENIIFQLKDCNNLLDNIYQFDINVDIVLFLIYLTAPNNLYSYHTARDCFSIFENLYNNPKINWEKEYYFNKSDNNSIILKSMKNINWLHDRESLKLWEVFLLLIQEECWILWFFKNMPENIISNCNNWIDYFGKEIKSKIEFELLSKKMNKKNKKSKITI